MESTPADAPAALARVHDGAREETTEGTLCFIRNGERVLLIHKKRGIGAGLYNGPGGKVEPSETPRECVKREVREEIEVTVPEVEKVGELLFFFGDHPFMHGHVYCADAFEGEPTETPEADPEWFHVDDVPYDEMWEDDRYWLPHVLEGDTVAGTFWFDDDGDELLDRAVDVDVEL